MNETTVDFEEISRRYDEEVRRKENRVRRYEIARAIAQAIVVREGYESAGALGLIGQDIAMRSVQLADALIAELQRPTADDTGKEPGEYGRCQPTTLAPSA